MISALKVARNVLARWRAVDVDPAAAELRAALEGLVRACQADGERSRRIRGQRQRELERMAARTGSTQLEGYGNCIAVDTPAGDT